MLTKITTGHMGLNLELDGLARVNYLVGVNGSGKTRFFESLKLRTGLYIDHKDGKNLDLNVPVRFYASGGEEFNIAHHGSIANHRFDLDPFMAKGDRRVETPLGDSFVNHPMTQKLIQVFYPDSDFELKMGNENFVNFRDLKNPELGWRRLDDSSGGFQSLFKLWSLTWHQSYPKGYGLYLLGFDEGDRHLHPTLAKQLPSILDELIFNFEHVMQSNSNGFQGAKVQVFVATHSPFTVRGALEHHGHKIFHLESGALKHSFDRTELIKKSGIPFDDVLNGLGFKMQDLYYPETLICVEGPVDALYLQYWLEKYLEEKELSKNMFIKGVHYDFFEFGGALAAHLTFHSNVDVDSDEVLLPQNIVNVLSLNRKVFLMVDNDSGNAFETTKKRLKTLIDQRHGCIYFRSDKYRTIECLLSESTAISKDSNKVRAAVVNLNAWRKNHTPLSAFNPEVYPLMDSVFKFLSKSMS